MEISSLFSILWFILSGTNQSTPVNEVPSFLPTQVIDLAKKDDLEVIYSDEDETLFIAIHVEEKDWWESLHIGQIEAGEINWLPLQNPPSSQSIYSARFMSLEGFEGSLIEVYDITHMNNGSFYLYQKQGNKVVNLLKTRAFDANGGLPKYTKKYQQYDCGETLKDWRLFPDYKDLNGDGATDLILQGFMETNCIERNKSTALARDKIKMASIPIVKIFIWVPEKNKFVEYYFDDDFYFKPKPK